MVYSTDRSKAVVPVLVFLLVALWFILRGDLFYRKEGNGVLLHDGGSGLRLNDDLFVKL